VADAVSIVVIAPAYCQPSARRGQERRYGAALSSWVPRSSSSITTT
jgi:hypothetical protein